MPAATQRNTSLLGLPQRNTCRRNHLDTTQDMHIRLCGLYTKRTQKPDLLLYYTCMPVRSARVLQRRTIMEVHSHRRIKGAAPIAAEVLQIVAIRRTHAVVICAHGHFMEIADLL
jgi:hypothetical protein